jgi:hypothetical protein
VRKLAEDNIHPNAHTAPFQQVTEIQRWASSIAATTVSPPSTLVSEDCMSIMNDGQTLEVQLHRDGMKKRLGEIWELVEKYQRGYRQALDVPKNPVDNWPDRRRGYGGLQTHAYIPPDDFVNHLIKVNPGRLHWTDEHGHMRFNGAVIDELVREDGAIVEALASFMFVTCSVARVSEFAEAKITNSVRERTLLLRGEDMWLVTRRMKWENRVRHAEFVPYLVPEPVRMLLLRYLVVIRPAVVALLRVIGKEELAQQYSEYLFMVDEDRMSVDVMRKKIQWYMRVYSQVDMGARRLRHCTVRF